MDDISGAAQILEASINGITLAGRATIEAAKILQRLLLLSASFFKFAAKLPFKGRRYFKYKKTKGKTNIDNLKQKGGTLEMAAFSAEGYEMFQKAAKKWGLLFHENPTFGKEKQETVYISYPAEQAPVMEKILEAMKSTKSREYQKESELKADKMGLKGKERKEFVAALVQDSLQMFQNGNYKTGLEEYSAISGIGRCTSEEFEAAMRECYGEAYEEVKMELNEGFKKKKFDDVADELSVWRENAEPVWICERNQPDNYIRVSWEKQETVTKNGESKEYLASEFEVYYQGKKQTCEEFEHGNFSHYSQKNGNQSSEKGEEHWSNLKSEMKRKGGFSEEVLVFSSEKEYLNYKKQCLENDEKKEEVIKNSRKEERDRRVENGEVVFIFSEKDIVDVDREEGKIKVDTGIRDKEGKNYFLWMEQKDIYYKEGKQFEFLFHDIGDITLTSLSGNRKVSMPAVEFMKKTGGFEEHQQRRSKYIQSQFEKLYNPDHSAEVSKEPAVENRKEAEPSEEFILDSQEEPVIKSREEAESSEELISDSREEPAVENPEKPAAGSPEEYDTYHPEQYDTYHPEEFDTYHPEEFDAYDPEESAVYNPAQLYELYGEYHPDISENSGTGNKERPESGTKKKSEKVPEQKPAMKR